MDCAWHDNIALTVNGIWKNLSLQFVHDFCGYEKQDEVSKKVFKNLLTLSQKLEVDLQEHDFIKLVSVQHEELTSEDQMELEVWRKVGEKQEEEVVTEELKRFMSQRMAREFSLF